MFKELRRVVYQVGDVQKAKQWYASVLGVEPVFDSPVAAIFRIGHDTMSLTKAPPGPSEEGHRITAYWEVDDTDKAFARLLELGASPKSTPSSVLNIRTAQVIDPFGNVIGVTGEIPSDQRHTIDNHPSETAHAVALCRALMARDERPEIRRADPFSELFLTEEVRASLRDEATCRAIIDSKISRPLYSLFVARTGFIDDVLRRALRARVPQVVFLGAGYDTRALRFRADLGSTRVIELDAPSTQERKTTILRASHTDVPAQVQFVSMNFKTDDIVERLRHGGFDPSLATLFVWEGVTYYLAQEAVDRTLDLVWNHSAHGSGIVFDYMTTRLESINPGEPFLSWMAPATLPDYLARRGFHTLDHLDASEMVKRYLTLHDGTVAEEPLSTIRLVYAERAEGMARD